MAKELEHIRQYVNACVGRDVKLIRSERKSRAVAAGAYLTVFTVLFDGGRWMSCTYAELLTGASSLRLPA